MTTERPISAQKQASIAAAFRLADFTVLLTILSADIDGDPIPADLRPAWVIKCGRKACKALFPLAYKLVDEEKEKAYRMGLAVGMMRAGEITLATVVREMGLDDESPPSSEQKVAIENLLFGANSGMHLPEHGESLMPKEMADDVAKLQEGLDINGHWLLQQGLADGLGMMAGQNAATDATAVHKHLVIYWRAIEVFETSEQVHQFLTKILGANVVGPDPRRITQILGRVGKRFKRGRPKKTHQRDRTVK